MATTTKCRIFSVLFVMSLMTWTPPANYTDGTPIDWEDTARIFYVPCVSTSPTGPWKDQPMTEQAATWADVPTPAEGETLYYSCRAILDGQVSAYQVPKSLTGPITEPAPTTKPGNGWGKGGKKR